MFEWTSTQSDSTGSLTAPLSHVSTIPAVHGILSVPAWQKCVIGLNVYRGHYRTSIGAVWALRLELVICRFALICSNWNENGMFVNWPEIPVQLRLKCVQESNLRSEDALLTTQSSCWLVFEKTESCWFAHSSTVCEYESFNLLTDCFE